VVAANGTGQFKTVQAAVDAALPHAVIHIKAGTYRERVVVPPDKPFLTFRGENAATTILTFDPSTQACPELTASPSTRSTRPPSSSRPTTSPPSASPSRTPPRGRGKLSR